MRNTDFNQFEKTLHETLSLGSHIQFGQQIIIAVSGGKDSMTLLYSMCRITDRLNIKIKVVHLNHHLRGNSNNDQILVDKFCKKLFDEIKVSKEIKT